MTVSTNTDGVYRFTALSPLATHYVWVDGVYAGQTVTPGNKEVELEYYTVALTSGANITAVSGSGVYLKGTGITISATVHAGDFVSVAGRTPQVARCCPTITPMPFP